MDYTIGNIIYKELNAEPLNDVESGQLSRWLEASQANRDVYEQLNSETNLKYKLRRRIEWEEQAESSFKDFEDTYLTSGSRHNGPSTIPVHRVHFIKTAWFRYAAAILLLIIGVSVYYIFHTSQPQVEVAQTTPSPLPKQDVLPGSEKAILTLSYGQQVQLDNATSETIKDGTLSIENINGQLSYSGSLSPAGGSGAGGAEGGSREARTATNTMQTPRGGQYKLTLSDGTKVWLNAASSITYPIAFTEKTRTVSITGEAYFEVTKNKEKPFIVKTRSDEITVLGTSFNVNAYEDEAAVKTSLLEGSVKVGDTNIKPGQAYENGKVIPTDVKRDVAWKNGVFIFNGSDMRSVMRQLARWYDIEVKYEGKGSDEKLIGKLSRNLPLSEVLEVLKAFRIKTRLEGKTLIVE